MSDKKKGGFFKRLFNRVKGEPAKVEEEKTEQPAQDIQPSPQTPPAQPEEQQVETATSAEIQPEPEIEVQPELEPAPEPEPKPEPEVLSKPEPEPEPEVKPEPAPKPKAKPAPEVLPEPEPKPEPVVKPEPEPAPEPKPAPKAKPEPAPAPKAKPKPEPKPQPTEKKGWFGRLRSGLAKSSSALTGGITSVFTKRKLDADTIQDFEDILIQSDLGIDMATRITDRVSKGRFDKEIDPQEVKQILADEISAVLKPVEIPFTFDDSQKPFVILVVGVNGAGKTTTIGKLGAIAKSEGFSLTIAACDTFRAAAVEQLKVWGERIGADVISAPTGADAAGLAFDAQQQAKASASDILIIDTAGRLQNKTDLMAELEKIVRVMKKQDASAPHAVLLVLDATTGQNAITQTEIFTKTAGVTGIIMTKLDGTARGGILVAIAEKFKLPIHAIGVGEQIEDFQPFDADAFARAIAGLDEE